MHAGDSTVTQVRVCGLVTNQGTLWPAAGLSSKIPELAGDAGSYRVGRGRCVLQHAVYVVLFGFAEGTLSAAAQADNFVSVYYETRSDQLVVTMSYRGTNPDHTFSLKWGRCKDTTQDGGRKIVAEVLDSQWQDAEQRDFQKTTRFNLSDVRCRPAQLTLRTAPRFLYTLQLPARPIQGPQSP